MTDTQQQPWTHPTPLTESAPPPGVAWYRRHWVQLVAVGVVGLGVGGAGASGDDLSGKLAAAESRATTAEAKVSAAEGRATAAEQVALTATADAEKAVAPKVAAAIEAQKGAVDAERTRLGQVRTELGALRTDLAAQKADLDRRAAAVGSLEQAAEANSFDGADAKYIVGVDIKPGTYRGTASDGCYYARLSSMDDNDIEENNNTDGPVVVQIKASDKAFQVSDCGTFTRIGP